MVFVKEYKISPWSDSNFLFSLVFIHLYSPFITLSTLGFNYTVKIISHSSISLTHLYLLWFMAHAIPSAWKMLPPYLIF